MLAYSHRVAIKLAVHSSPPMLKTVKHEHLKPAYEEMFKASTLPLWEIYGDLITETPTPIGDPYIWRYAQLRPLLVDAGSQISAAEAERRVLALKNPGLDRPGVAATLFAGLQMVLPGEVAPAHRHTQGAIRFVLESDGGYTAVQGERCLMRRGDFITTPAWCWHDHKNDGDSPLIWLDGLDIPIVGFFGARFGEQNESDQQPIFRDDDNSVRRWGKGLKPFRGEHTGLHSPVYSYPYEQVVEALAAIESAEDPDPHHGWKMVYANPMTGGHVLPTIAAFAQKYPAGFKSRVWRTTESAVFAVVEGKGVAHIGDSEFQFAENDVMVAPNWTDLQFETSADTVLFSFSDRAPQELLGLFREQHD